MDSKEFKEKFYLVLEKKRISDIEIYFEIAIRDKKDNNRINGLGTRVNTLDIDQNIADSQFNATPISAEKYINQAIQMLFNLVMFRLNISDVYDLGDRESITEFFKDSPFFEE